MILSGGLSRAEAAKHRRALLAEIKREQRKADRAKLESLRAAIADVIRRRKDARARAVEVCRAERRNVAERIKAERAAALALVRALADKERSAAREACNARKSDIRSSGKTAEQKERALLAEERAYQAEIRRAEATARKRDKPRTTAKERQEESDDEVRRNLPPDLLPLFEQVKRQIKGSGRISRTEQFLQFAEEHPREVVNAMQELSDRELARLQAEEARIYAELEREQKPARARQPRPKRATAPEPRNQPVEYVIEVPF